MNTQLHRSTRTDVALAAVCVAALILPMSFSGGAVVTPAIGRSLGGNLSGLAWITNAFMLPFGGLLMTAGALADRWGRKRVFMVGVGLFAVASLMFTLAPTLAWIDLLRAAQGVGAAAALAGGTAALAQEVSGSSRARAFSLLGTTFGVGLAFGPLVAGVLMNAAGWRAVLAAPAGVAALALLLGSKSLRETRAAASGPMDWAGAATFTLALVCLTVFILQGAGWGWTSPPAVLLFAAAIFGFALFVHVERHSAAPILDLSLLSYPRFLGVQLLPIATCYCFVVLLVLLPLQFIGVGGQSEICAGITMLGLSTPLMFAPTLAVWAARRYSAGTISAIGLLAASLGLLWLSGCGPGSGATPLPAMLLIGTGAGLPWGLMDGLSIAVVPPDRAGMAAGVFGTIRVAGEGIALASVTAGLATLVRWRLDTLAIGPQQARPSLAEHLAIGDLTGAARLGVSMGTLRDEYAASFAVLLYVLAAVTCLSAVLVFFTLRRVDPHGKG
ncbi:MFS transporter [Sphingomonas sp.]|uniref:MFS transporter n=1 Tax=Sphingomonas sp. TaxID=28214 RepID=UPI002FDA9014